jgi:DNA-binding PadR family transcriptional regulator
MPIPKITPLQFLIIGLLIDGEMSGRELRDRLAAFGERKGFPAFYRLMGRMEEGGSVAGRYETREHEDQTTRERFYRATTEGIAAWEEARTFFAWTEATPQPQIG